MRIKLVPNRPRGKSPIGGCAWCMPVIPWSRREDKKKPTVCSPNVLRIELAAQKGKKTAGSPRRPELSAATAYVTVCWWRTGRCARWCLLMFYESTQIHTDRLCVHTRVCDLQPAASLINFAPPRALRQNEETIHAMQQYLQTGETNFHTSEAGS